jgi:protein-tyrosine-phosphatase
MPRVLVVCTGNLCRSPMFAGFLRARLHRDERRCDWEVRSAGVWAADGSPASTYAVDELAQRGIDLRDHRSRTITRCQLEAADLVLVMTRNHAEALSAAFPAQAHKVHLVSEMVGRVYDIADPYGGTRMEYAHTAKELEQLVDEGYERIVTLVEGNAAEPSGDL